MRFENGGAKRRPIAERKEPTFDKVPGKDIVLSGEAEASEEKEGALVTVPESAVVTVPKNEVALVKEGGVSAVLPENKKIEKKKEEPPTITKGKKIKATIVENAEAFNTQARDTADEKMTADKAELRGFKGFVQKIWKHNFAQEYYRQKEVAKAKTAMEGRGSLFEGDDDTSAHKEAMGSIIKRFASEYEEAVHINAGETRETLDESSFAYTEVKKLIFDYAEGVIDKDTFLEEKARVLAGVIHLDKEKVEKGLHHADDLLQVAEGVKQSIEHGEALNRLDVDFEIVVGRAKSGVRTEAQFNTVDRLVDKIQSTKIGRFVDESTVASSIAIAYAVSAGLSQRIASSKAAAWGSFGLAAVLGAGIAGAREGRMIENDRRQHFREMAKGKKFDSDPDIAPRRTEMEQFRYKSILATEQIALLTGAADAEDATPEVFMSHMAVLADTNARIGISDTKKIDLLTYTDERLVDEERLQLDIARAEARVNLKALAERLAATNPNIPTGDAFDTYLQTLMGAQEKVLTESDEGIDEKNRAFSKLKKRKIAKAAVKGLVTGLTIGALAQEGISLLRDGQQGLIESALDKNNSAQTTTALEGIRRYFAGADFPLADAAPVETLVGGNKITLPAGVTMEAGASGAFKLIHEGKVLADGLKFENGVLSQASRDTLSSLGIDTHINQTQVTTTERVSGAATDMVKERPDLFARINRGLWYDNNTPAPKFDENELRLKWGGKAGTGVDASGKVVFDVSSMTAGGSRHGAFSVNAQEAIKEGKLKMLFSLSRGSQAFAVDVPVDASGKVVIDPNSEIGKMFFEIKNGKAVFKGGFAEVAHEAGDNPKGGKNYRILATHKGLGQDTVSWERTVTKGSNSSELNFDKFAVAKEPKDFDLPPFIPVFGRQPLERTRRGEGRVSGEVPPPGGLEAGAALAAPLALAGPAIAGLLEYQGPREVSTESAEYTEYRNRLRSTVLAFREALERTPNLAGINPEVHRLLAELLAADSSMSFEEYRRYTQERLDRLREIIRASERRQIGSPQAGLAYAGAPEREDAAPGAPAASSESVIRLGGPEEVSAMGGSRIIRVGTAYMGGNLSKKKRMQYKSEFSPKMSTPGVSLDTKGESQRYLGSQEANHKSMVERMATSMGPMSESCKLSIGISVASDKEGANIYRTLEQYTTQSADKGSFELVLFVNRPTLDAEGNVTVPDATLSEINRFKQDYPDLPVKVMELIFTDKVGKSYAQKLLNDTILYRHAERQTIAPNSDHILVSNEVGARGVSREYVKGYIDSFARNPKVESLIGRIDYDPVVLMKNPILHVNARLLQYMDIQLRKKQKSAEPLPGVNMAFRGSIYAGVGGYGVDDNAPSLSLGRKIQYARQSSLNFGYIPLGYAPGTTSRIYSSLKHNGVEVPEDEITQEVDFEDGAQIDLFKNQLEKIINETYDSVKDIDPANSQRFFDRSLHLLGVTCERAEGSGYKVIKADKLIEGLKVYKREGLEVRRRKVAAAAA